MADPAPMKFSSPTHRRLVYRAVPAAILAWGLFHARPGVNVSVQNETGAEIADVAIRFTGGSALKPRLPAGAIFATRVRSRGESDLTVEFKDAAGRPHSQLIDVYFERGYRGTIAIHIRPDGTVRWKDETKIGVSLPFGL